MAELEDPFRGMATFVRAVDAGSFSAAARALGTTPSAVSKAVARLERRLGVRLLQRSTRALGLTPAGLLLHERATRLLNELDDAEAALASRRGLRGVLRVSASVGLGGVWVGEVLQDFLSRHRGLRAELMLTDRLVDLVEERVDVAVRVGALPASRLVARRLGEVRFMVCGAPAYLKRAGTPRRPEELARHSCLRFLSGGRPMPWRFAGGGEVEVEGPLDSDNGEVLRDAASAGLGLVATLDVLTREHLAAGRLRPVLAEFAPPPLPVHAIFTPTRSLAPAVHAFVDALAGAWPTLPATGR